MLTQNYEISVWRPGANSSEVKLFTVGGSNFSSPFKAVEPQFEQKSNGEIKLSFVLYSNVIDNYTGEKLENPFIAEMQNENRVKLKLDGKWYDFVIKTVTEDSDKKSFKYEGVGLAQIELSKTGYSLNFNTELNNNIGKLTDLAKQVLDGSDWQVDQDNSDKIVEKIETPLYSATLNADVTVTRVVGLRPGDSSVSGDGKNRSWTIYKNTQVYVPYTSCSRGENNAIKDNKSFFQFFYQPGKSLADYPVDQDGFLEEAYLFYGDFSSDTSNTSNICSGHTVTNVRGRCVSKNPISKYHEAVGGVVKSYVKNENGKETEYWGYTKDEYSTSEIIRNFISPSKDFEITSNWRVIGNGKVELVTVPEDLAGISESWGNSDIYQCIKISELNKNSRIINMSLNSNKIFLNKNGIAAGEKWRWKIVLDNSDDSNSSISEVQIYSLGYNDDNSLKLNEKLFSWVDEEQKEESDSVARIKTFSGQIKAEGAYSYDQLKKKKIAMVITPSETVKSMTIKEIQLYREIPKETSGYYEIGEKPEVSIITNHYIFSKDSTAKKEEDLEILYSSTEGFGDYELQYDWNFEKSRSLAGAETNRLDLLQKLAENFKTWLFFEIDHEDDGRIKFEDGAPLKKVVFKEYIQKDNYAGFKYGINLSSIQRKIESQDICTKLIVKNNSNQYAKNGFCSIARSPENFSRENVIYNFDYYTINRNILSENEIKEALYGESGLYTQMEIENINKIEYIDEIALLTSATIPKLQSSLEAAIKTRDTALEEFWDLDEKLKQITSGDGYDVIISDKSEPETKLEKWLKHTSAKDYLVQCSRFRKAADEAIEKIDGVPSENKIGLQTQLDAAEDRLAELQDEINKKAENIKNLISAFDKKYAGFVQEGAWISEDYTDDTLYYLDAVAAESRSAKPKVSYTINVLDISKANDGEFGDYTFDVGERTFIEDTEFFGYDQYGRPYQEEVVIQQLTRNLDDPSKNKITVKNYKTEFDDLFQRVASMTTKIEFDGGGYKRAANAFKEDGTLTNNILTRAMLDNQLILSNSSNNSVVWDSSGITTTNLDNPNEQVRIVGGGIVLTRDGGETWSTGISGKGINAKYIVTGQLDTSLIQIINGDDAAFIWDANGLNAYAKDTSADEDPINYNSYIRFNGDGIVGEEVHTGVNGTSTETFFKLDKNGLVVNRGTIYASSMMFSDGKNEQPGGPIVKKFYLLSNNATKPPLSNDPNWDDEPPTSIDDGQYTWVKTITYYSADSHYEEIYCLNGAPGANGAPGKSLVVMYYGSDQDALPSNVQLPVYENGTLKPYDWKTTDSNITKPYIFMTQTLEGENNWTNPIRVNGTDSNLYERIYKLTKSKNDKPSKPYSDPNEDDYIPDNTWKDTPQGVTMDQQAEWACERRKTRGASTWGNFSEPTLYSTWGEKGQDGDGIEYVFKLSNSESYTTLTKPNDFEASSIKNADPTDLKDWSDDPPKSTVAEPYTFVCKGKVTKTGTDTKTGKDIYQFTWGDPALWSKRGDNGENGAKGDKGDDGVTYTPTSQTIHYSQSEGSYNQSGLSWLLFANFPWNSWDPTEKKIHERITTTYVSNVNSNDKKFSYTYRTLSLMEAVETALSSKNVKANNKITIGDTTINAGDTITTLAVYCVDRNLTIIDGSSIATGSITAAQIAAHTITTDQLNADILTTEDYKSSYDYETAVGSKFDLTYGAFDSPRLKWDKNGNLYCSNLLIGDDQPSWTRSNGSLSGNMNLNTSQSGSYLRFNNGNLDIRANSLSITGGWPDGNNLLMGTKNFENTYWTAGGTESYPKWSRKSELVDGFTAFRCQERSVRNTLAQNYFNGALQAGKTYTISGYTNARNLGLSYANVSSIGINNASTVAPWIQLAASFEYSSEISGDGYYHFQVTFTATSSTKQIGVFSDPAIGDAYPSIYGLKLELGESATGWTPHRLDGINTQPNLMTGTSNCGGTAWKSYYPKSGSATWTATDLDKNVWHVTSISGLDGITKAFLRDDPQTSGDWTYEEMYGYGRFCTPTQDIPVTKGHTYTVSCWCKIENLHGATTEWGRLVLDLNDIPANGANADSPSYDSVGYRIAMNNTSWKRISFTGVANRNKIRPAFITFNSPSSAAARPLIAGLKVEESNVPTPYTGMNSESFISETLMNQEAVFNALTNNGETQGVYLNNNKVYINAEYIQSGTLSANYIKGGALVSNNWEDEDGNEGLYFNLQTGALQARKNFSVNASDLVINPSSLKIGQRINIDSENYQLKSSNYKVSNEVGPTYCVCRNAYRIKNTNGVYGHFSSGKKLYSYQGIVPVIAFKEGSKYKICKDGGLNEYYESPPWEENVEGWVTIYDESLGLGEIKGYHPYSNYSNDYIEQYNTNPTWTKVDALSPTTTSGTGGKIDLQNGTLDLWCGEKRLQFSSAGLKINGNTVG